MEGTRTILACAAFVAASLKLTGCLTTKTYADRNTSILLGLAEVDTNS